MNLRHLKKCRTATIVVPLFILLLHPALAGAKGPMQTIWGCRIPCAVKTTKSPLKGVYITYCAVSSLGLRMIEKATPECQTVNHRADAVAVRNSDGAPATCDSSSNVCTTEGPVNTGFVCKMLCPSEDSVIHKFSTPTTILTARGFKSFAKTSCSNMPFLIGGKLKIMPNFLGVLQAGVACAKLFQIATSGQALTAFQLPLPANSRTSTNASL